jgi:ABC-type methionine transport system permease subunit
MPSEALFHRIRVPLWRRIVRRPDLLWTCLWLGGLVLLWVWLAVYLNAPARALVGTAFLNTLLGAVLVVCVALVLGWQVGVALHAMEKHRHRRAYLPLAFGCDLIRSVPQILGMLAGYVLLTALIRDETLRTPLIQLIATSIVTSLFLFLEVADLIRSRIAHYENLEFVNALLVCGVPERVIVNKEILLKNSLVHIIQKGVALFGRAIFLLCSIDFIISVGLGSDVSLANFPVTLGNMLAKLDSKQDILAIGTVFSDPAALGGLFVEHLQGISVAFIIVFTLLCTYKISNGILEKYKL